MIAGIGIDITEIERVKTAAQKHPQFITKVLTPAEQQQLAALTGQRYWEYLSSRFSLKESFAKAFGTGIGSQVNFQDVSVVNNELGKPEVTQTVFAGNAHASVSHTATLVMTEIILEDEDGNC
ncbi:holo-ACP synthase [Limosilactobacillus equigenerosi]|uniref:Holo-[acyl-carrier-protein] synthase n=1 Tax=Limosilactobacillus equigenerosi DSM 18793 = JCM 14505 TaxID=1423742 RepID=A0A0R1UUD5_9LACO|nr:holo-ACP synthase [Limosilactobacillus equigenerosi]KRL94626.1 Holo-[acyl-carrier-protein] synthase [Limosilactobacillus equigenerosi DSM 18793 = JCM 14505]MCQ2569484.1 holo-ACP synthase [Limosilactobacillus sp.]